MLFVRLSLSKLRPPMRTFTVVVILFVVGTTAIDAQEVREVLRGDDRLKVVKSVQILTEEVDDEGQKCGLTTESLTLAAAKSLLDNSIKVQKDSTFTIYLNTTSLALPSGCITNLEVHLYTYAEGRSSSLDTDGVLLALAATKEGVAPPKIPLFLLAGRLELLDGGTLLSGPRNNHPTRVRDAVGRFVTEFATKIRLASQ